MPYGLTEEELKLIKEVFHQHKKTEKVILFGSRAMERHHKASDIDLDIGR